jgi:hypothetical protein
MSDIKRRAFISLLDRVNRRAFITLLNSDNFRRCKLRIAAREWLLSKLLPKKYSWDWFLDDNLRDELNLHVKREGGSK